MPINCDATTAFPDQVCSACGNLVGYHEFGTEACPAGPVAEGTECKNHPGFRQDSKLNFKSVNIVEQLKRRAEADELAARRGIWPKPFEVRAGLRKCAYWDEKTSTWPQAYFHAWGLDGYEVAGGAMTYSIAIIESESGSIKKVNPEDLKFIS